MTVLSSIPPTLPTPGIMHFTPGRGPVTLDRMTSIAGHWHSDTDMVHSHVIREKHLLFSSWSKLGRCLSFDYLEEYRKSTAGAGLLKVISLEFSWASTKMWAELEGNYRIVNKLNIRENKLDTDININHETSPQWRWDQLLLMSLQINNVMFGNWHF